MEAKLQRRVQRYGWDAAAAVYEHSWQDNLAQTHEAMLGMAKLEVGDHVLEVACGSGLLTFRAADLVGPSGSIRASDISAEMVEIVAARAKALAYGHVTVARADAEALDAPGASFDAALCALGLMYMPDPGEALATMSRALRSDGRVVVAVWGERRNCAWAEIFPIVDSVVQSEVCPLFFNLGAGDNLASVMQQSGFADIEAERFQVDLSFDNVPRMLEAIVEGGAVAMAAKRFDATTRAYVEKAYLETVVSFKRRGGGYDVPSEFVVAVGYKR